MGVCEKEKKDRFDHVHSTVHGQISPKHHMVDEEFQPKDVYITIFSYSLNAILATGNDMFDTLMYSS